MKVCIRPFGVGIQDVETDELVSKTKQGVKNLGFFLLGVGVLVAERALGNTANALYTAANAVEKKHGEIITYAEGNKNLTNVKVVPVQLNEGVKVITWVKK